MNNQRGITLVELLVIILIMGAIFVPISIMVNNSLKTEREVAIKNGIQREARFIMEYVTEEMRDSGTVWNIYGSESKQLIDKSTSKVLLDYQKSSGRKGIVTKDNVVLSENVADFTITDHGNLINVKLIIEKSGVELELQSDIIHSDMDRF